MLPPPISWLYNHMEDNHPAFAFLEESLTISRQLDDKMLQAFARDALTDIRWRFGDFDKARTLYAVSWQLYHMEVMYAKSDYLWLRQDGCMLIMGIIKKWRHCWARDSPSWRVYLVCMAVVGATMPWLAYYSSRVK